ncbi:putative ABC transport system permease protein [Pseudomonas cuatrocienegasensis]|uniref:ABC transport system permease protein n=1 Tax=Pseudomonas cuatrocienegasensis TaxID=543360 RepID=A0ABY1B9F8_9PSED|nr:MULTISPECIES: FtsX-like permease family protein [Pseudomonas]OEC33487.1 ABC transporter permease [Pseudomonas sp. 21C1]SEQ26943.1 putative ABC transport system permease protein [Pseudomonas cuatrocienegasensis]
MRLCLLALLSHWRRHPLQGASILTGLWLATALWTGVQALNSQARADYARASAVLATPAQAQVLPRQGQYLAQADYVTLRRAGWAVTPLLEGRLRLPGEAGGTLQVIGIEPLSLPAGSQVAGQPGEGVDLLAFIGKPGQAWIAPDTRQRLGLPLGETMPLSEGLQLPPLVEQAQLAPGVVVVDIAQAQALLQVPEQMSRLLLAGTAEPTLPAELADRLRVQPAEGADDLQRLTDSFHLNLTALGLLAFIVGLFIVHAAIGLALEQRRALLRTLRACGVGLATLLAALTLELGLFAVLSGVLGVASGYLIASLLLADVSASLRGLYGAEVAGQLSLPAIWWLAGVAISLLGALLAGLSSLVRAARLPLLALAQPQAWRQAQSRWLRGQALLALGLLVLAAICWGLGDSLVSAFVLMASLLLAAALLLPALLDGALALLARRCRGPLSEWFIADSRQQLPALSLALMALLLALAASVGVGSMTQGFRLTFSGWLDQRLAADLYVSAPNTTQTQLVMDALAAQPGVEALLPNWTLDTRLQGWPVQLQGIVDDPHYREGWPLLEQQADAWAQLAAGQGVMLSEQLARRLNLRLGERLTLPAPSGEQALPVVALYADYGNPKGQALVAADWLRRAWPEATLGSLAVHLAPSRGEAVQAWLEAAYADAGVRVIDQAGLKAWSNQVFERTFAATAALNSLTLGVAGIALFISLLTLGHSRLGQLAPLWALGLGRRQLAGLSLGQTLLLAGLTVLLAMPLGVLLAYCLVAVVNVQAFGWRLPLYIFPGQLLNLAALGLCSSLLAASGPLWQLARRQPADLLRTFAHER